VALYPPNSPSTSGATHSSYSLSDPLPPPPNTWS